jgi:hypothetical protein
MRGAAAAGLCLLGLTGPFAAAAAWADGALADGVPVGSWSPRKLQFAYVGMTTAYSCDSLERQVGRILRYFGARADLRVRATGCPGSLDSPSRNAWIDAQFQVLTPAADAHAPDAVPARWVAIDLSPRGPNFMDAGDCDLIQEMKPGILASFSLRDAVYRVSCFPHEANIDGFSIKGEALQPVVRKPG